MLLYLTCELAILFCFFCIETATTEIYTYLHTLSLHDSLPICCASVLPTTTPKRRSSGCCRFCGSRSTSRSEEHTSELQSLMRFSYAVFCLQKNKNINKRPE